MIERFHTCSKDCYGGCVFRGYWEDTSNHPLRNTIALKSNPFTQGVFCGKLSNRREYFYHPNRIKSPLVKEKNGSDNFREISLEEAYSKISQKVKEVIQTHGADTILGAFYSGNTGLISQYSPLRFFNSIGSTITTGGICNEGGCAGLASLFGTYSTANPLQINNPETKLIVVWGSNLTENNNHAYLLVRKARKRGVKLVVIDSRYTKIAQEADLFIPALPGTDHLIARYVLHLLVKHQHIDREFVTNHVDDYQSVLDEIKTLENDFFKTLEKSTLGNKSKIEIFAELLHQFQHHTIINIGYGVQKDKFGGRIVRSIALLQIFMGNIGKPGVGIIYSQSDSNKKISVPLIEYISQSNEINPKTIHIRELASELDTGKFKIIFIYNFNPASSVPNQVILREALSRENLFVVVLDLFHNETTKYADIVIPAKFDVETFDLLTPYYYPSLSVNQAGVCPYDECVSNHEFFQELGKRLGCDMKFESNEEIYEKCMKILPENIRIELENQGFYSKFNPNYIPYTNLTFPTPTGNIICRGPHFNFNYPLLMDSAPPQFFLITPNKGNYLHSQLGGSSSERGIYNNVLMNSDNCSRLGFKEGDLVIVKNTNCEGVFSVKISDEILENTVAIYHGLFSQDGVNANFFTSETAESMGKSGSFNSFFVFVKPLED